MRAIEVERRSPIESRPLRVVERPLPEPGPGEVRVRVRACGICRTDLHVVEGDLPPVRSPLIPGHQVVGIVDAVGAKTSRFAVGDRIGIAWLRHTCGTCEACRRGDENLCPDSRYTGHHENGGYAEWAVVPEAYAYAIPDVFPDADATPLLCAGIIGYRALVRAECPPGGRLALFGFGSSAHIVIQLAIHRGIEVFVATRGEKHRRMAGAMGATWVGETLDRPPVPCDSAIVFAPAGEVVPAALRAVRPGGTVALAGVTMTDLPAMAYEPHLFHEKRLTSVEANTRADGEALLREAAVIPIRPKTVPYPLERAQEALLALKRDGIEGTAVLVS
jgi:propanol-preferring alcohol dehydrogenase